MSEKQLESQEARSEPSYVGGEEKEAILEWTPEEEKRIVRKFDTRVLTLLCALFMMSFLDRANIGNAYTAGMADDLNLSSSQYQNLLTLFYVGYIVGQPCTLLWKALQPRYFVAFLTLCWGTLALCQAAAKGWAGLMVIRTLLGVAETAFAPGVTYYLSMLYRPREVGLRQGLYLGAAPIATAYAGALAYGLTSVKGAAVQSWQLLFLVEGAPALLMVPVVYFFLPNTAGSAYFLTERERGIVRERGRKEGQVGGEAGLSLKHVGEGLRDPKAYVHALLYFSANVSYSSLPLFLPTIVAEMGFSSIRAQGLTVPPYLASFIVVVAVAFASDRVGDRSLFIIPCALVGAIGYIVLAVCETTAARYTAVYLCACGIFPVIALLLPWVANSHPNESKRGAGFLLLNLIGQCGPLLGTRLYPAKDKPFYRMGEWVCAAFMLLVCVLSFGLRMYLRRENRKLDRQGDGAFRYTL